MRKNEVLITFDRLIIIIEYFHMIRYNKVAMIAKYYYYSTFHRRCQRFRRCHRFRRSRIQHYHLQLKRAYLAAVERNKVSTF